MLSKWLSCASICQEKLKGISIYEQMPLDSRGRRTLRPAGSGWVHEVVNGKAIIVTAGHVLKTAGPFWIRDASGEWLKLTTLGIDDLADVGVGATHAIANSYVQSFSQSPVTKGQEVYAVGLCQYGDNLVQVNGSVANENQTFGSALPEQKFSLLQIAMITQQGMSGAPVFDERGAIVGMMIKKFQEYGLALPMAVLSRVIDRILKNQHSEVNIGIKVLNCAAHFEETTKSIECGILVGSVDKDSKADLAGLRANDLIFEINGMKIAGLVCELHEACFLNDEVTLTIIRGPDRARLSLLLTLKE